GETKEYPRTIQELPPQPREIKPHPYGIEFGMLLKMLHDTKSHSLAGFLSSDFSRLSANLAQEICKAAKVSPDTRPRNVHGTAAETLYKTIQSTKIMAPPSNCISPIGEKAILHGLYKQIKGDFYTAVTRPPAVYRGNPFIIEAGLAFGKGPDQAAETAEAPAAPLAGGEQPEDDAAPARVRRLCVFSRKRERAKSEFRRRNIFELYIEEVVEACARLKGGKLPKEKLKNQLQKIALKRTGGAKTDEILGHESGPEGLPHSIIVTPEGTEGEAPLSPVSQNDTGGNGAAASVALETEASEPERKRRKKRKKR